MGSNLAPPSVKKKPSQRGKGLCLQPWADLPVLASSTEFSLN